MNKSSGLIVVVKITIKINQSTLFHTFGKSIGFDVVSIDNVGVDVKLDEEVDEDVGGTFVDKSFGSRVVKGVTLIRLKVTSVINFSVVVVDVVVEGVDDETFGVVAVVVEDASTVVGVTVVEGFKVVDGVVFVVVIFAAVLYGKSIGFDVVSIDDVGVDVKLDEEVGGTFVDKSLGSRVVKGVTLIRLKGLKVFFVISGLISLLFVNSVINFSVVVVEVVEVGVEGVVDETFGVVFEVVVIVGSNVVGVTVVEGFKVVGGVIFVEVIFAAVLVVVIVVGKVISFTVTDGTLFVEGVVVVTFKIFLLLCLCRGRNVYGLTLASLIPSTVAKVLCKLSGLEVVGVVICDFLFCRIVFVLPLLFINGSGFKVDKRGHGFFIHFHVSINGRRGFKVLITLAAFGGVEVVEAIFG
uniref:Uncharacterized protein n=1 Tax=Panagrolaimus sp. ES5 TaxID=591445 RepID=A0AC34FEC5_9BILA